jgi:hypothetical protein
MLNIVKHLFNTMISSRIDPSLSLRMTKKNPLFPAKPKRRVAQRSVGGVSLFANYINQRTNLFLYWRRIEPVIKIHQEKFGSGAGYGGIKPA